MNGLRITAGTLRGRRVPLPRGGQLRPTSERARQAYFNIVGPRIVNARFLDLFAGTGIFSLEACSRGAASSLAIDAVASHAAALEQLAASWKLPIEAIGADVLAGIARLGDAVFDLVYADPPYSYDGYDELLLAIDRCVHLAPGALVAIEHRRREQPISITPERLRYVRRAEYGEVWISFFAAEDPQGESR